MHYETRMAGTVHVFSIHGDLTFFNLGDIHNSIMRDIAATSSSTFLIDLTHAGRIDSSGLGAIVSIYKSTRSRKGTIGVLIPNENVEEFFHTKGLSKLFRVFNNESEAIRKMESEGSENPGNVPSAT